ncbi:MAG: Asp23/Gls24 family envelope stress response protein [Christensenellales bacterium]
MPMEVKSELGKIVYVDEVLRQIAGIVAQENFGVVGMSNKNAGGSFAELLKKENVSKGVKVRVSEDSFDIDLFIVVAYGVSVPAVAGNLIDGVKYSVENLTGLKVSSVNVNVQGIKV